MHSEGNSSMGTAVGIPRKLVSGLSDCRSSELCCCVLGIVGDAQRCFTMNECGEGSQCENPSR